LEPVLEGAWSVLLELHNDLEIEEVHDGAGRPLLLTRQGRRARVFLPEPGSGPLELRVSYRGRILEEGARKTWALADNFFWHPHTGQRDRATYELTVRWPERHTLLGSGQVVAEGKEGRQRWQTRRLDRPSSGIGFAFGRYKLATAEAAGTQITVGLDRGLQSFDPESLAEITATVSSALDFYQQAFGPFPYTRLEVASVPGSLSQSLPGFVTLSELMMLGNRVVGSLAGLEDRRTVVAHEVAHQWWGHAVGWGSYRDQWISEAMANYSALLWARQGHRGTPIDLGRGPTAGWTESLTRSLADGRPLESVGPLVLGPRLSSSLADAYYDIVYLKGGVVLDMLARRWGDERFTDILGAIARAADGHVIDTARFLELMEQASGADLDAFARRFVYGTGLVDVYYDYELVPPAPESASAAWTVRVVAEREVPYRFHHAIVERHGQMVLERQRIDQIDGEAVELIVPLRLLLAERERAGDRGGEAGDTPFELRRVLHGRLRLEGPRTEITFEVEEAPESLELDPDQQVFGRFWNARDDPKRIAYYRAYDRAAASGATEAREALETAIPGRRLRRQASPLFGLYEARLELLAGEPRSAA
ncbi:MAG: hypothetical protein MI919_06115, partial [Holophagales bacterium]|nr:hypothetical protein [Holophagales bacterium]